MASNRTFVTELATGLGMVGDDDLASLIARRSTVLTNLAEGDWERLRRLGRSGTYDTDFVAVFLNRCELLTSTDALGPVPLGRLTTAGIRAWHSDLLADGPGASSVAKC